MTMHVECTMIDQSGAILKSKLYKTFTEIGEFNAWYKSIKSDTHMVINIMRYNPMEKPLLKQINDVKLLQVSREVAT